MEKETPPWCVVDFKGSEKDPYPIFLGKGKRVPPEQYPGGVYRLEKSEESTVNIYYLGQEMRLNGVGDPIAEIGPKHKARKETDRIAREAYSLHKEEKSFNIKPVLEEILQPPTEEPAENQNSL